DLANLTKCQIPATDPTKTTIEAGGVLLFWCDGTPAQGIRHIGTALSKSGEQIGLTDSDGVTVLDSLTFGPQGDDVSFGRQPDGGDDWVYFDKAYTTPGSVNSVLPPADPPAFSVSAGLYTGPVTLTLSVASPPPGAHIYYTLDGSEPTNGVSSTAYNYMFQETSNGATIAGTGPTETRYHQTYEYDGTPITISATTNVRARVYATNYMPSPTITNSYILNLDNPSGLAVVSVTSQPSDLWGNYKDPVTGGILVMGPPPYGGPFWFNGSNLMQEEWNKPGYAEFFEPDGTLAFSQPVEIRSGGSTTQLGPQKPMVLYAVGGERFDYQVFPDLDIDSFRILVLHASGDDWPFTQLRDAVVQGLVRDIDIDTQAYRPAIVFVDGVYYGCMSIRERRNKDYIASHHDIDANNIDILVDYGYNDISHTFEGEINEGSASAYQAMINECFIGKDLSVPANYAAVGQRMEIDEYLDYMVTEICVSNTDWPGGNVRMWRPQVPDGRWRWVLLDTDYSFNLPALNSIAVTSGTYTNYNMINQATAPNSGHWSNPTASTYLFRRLLENPDFKNEFIRRVADHLNITFETNRVKEDIDAKVAAIYSEMTRAGGQIDLWNEAQNPWTFTHASMPYPGYWMVPIDCPAVPTWPTWEDSIQRMKDFADVHPAVLRDQVVDKFALDGTAGLTFNVNLPEAGQIKVNQLILPIDESGTWAGTYFENIPIEVTAMPNSGYRFLNWTGISGTSVATVMPDGSMTITANFVADATNDNSLVINEINYNSAPDFDPEDWVELYNPHNDTVDISGWQFKDQNDNSFTFGPNTTIGPNAYLVLCNNEIDFHSAFPTVENYIGNFTFKISNGGDTITLYDAEANPVDTVTFDDIDPWPLEPDGTGPTLELMNSRLDNTLPTSWAASANHGTPGGLNSRLRPVLYHDFAYDGEWINTIATITFSAVDAEGGTAATWYELDGAPERVMADSVTITTEGDHTLVLGATDGLDNETTVTLHVKIANLLLGDANLDGKVDVSDLGILASNYGTGSGFGWGDGDFTGDGQVDVSDLGILAAHYGTSIPEFLPGDANRDGSVDVSDLGTLAANYNAGSGFDWENGDFTGDGFVDVSDLGILAMNYGTVAVGTSSTMATSSTATSSITSSELEVETVPCDLDNDGRVGLGDLAFFSSVYGAQPGITTENPYAYAADFDGSGRVDLGDLAIFSTHYRQSRTEISTVPETPLTAAEMPAMLSGNDTAKSVIVGNVQKQIVAAILYEHVSDRDNKAPDEDIAILTQYWMMSMEDRHDDDDERDAVFAAVGTGDDMLWLFDE
ncbi:MAG: CotH kinase family protein, partial [Pirellulales bacterium]|nr:CotH kinase family protein [Pirellulales bacterium]